MIIVADSLSSRNYCHAKYQKHALMVSLKNLIIWLASLRYPLKSLLLLPTCRFQTFLFFPHFIFHGMLLDYYMILRNIYGDKCVTVVRSSQNTHSHKQTPTIHIRIFIIDYRMRMNTIRTKKKLEINDSVVFCLQFFFFLANFRLPSHEHTRS